MIKEVVTGFIHVFLAGCCLMLDLLAFETFNQVAIQALLCVYIVVLAKHSRFLLVGFFMVAIAVESMIFWGHVSYGLFIALFLVPLLWVLQAWIHHPLIASICALAIVTGIQTSMLISDGHVVLGNLLMHIGHFCINAVFLSIYWFFDKDGKQGDRS